MTDMTITACAPLPGPGLVARRGDLVVVTDGHAEGPDPLLSAVDEVAGGDGAALVLAAARAMLAHPGQFSGACAGITASGEVAVLVHGTATVSVSVDGGPPAELTASGSMLPVNRTFSGGTVTVTLLSGAPATPDDRLRLDGGVVYGAGLWVTVAPVAASGAVAPGPLAPGALAAGPLASGALPASALAAEGYPVPGAPSDDLMASGPAPALADEPLAEAGPPLAAEPAPPPDLPADEPVGYAEPSEVPAGPGTAPGPELPPEPAYPYPGAVTGDQPAGPVPFGAPVADLPVNDLGRAATLPPFNVPQEQSGAVSWWFTEGQELVAGPDEWRPPTIVVPEGGASLGREPRLHQPDPASDFEYVSFLTPDDVGQQDLGQHLGQEIAVDADPAGPDSQPGADPYVSEPAMVDGVLCARNHFNDPGVQYCRQCGIAMVQMTQHIQKGPRPPLGVLLLDDGTGFTLDRDYVVGREPVLDGDVAAGRARPLRIPDPGGTVSRLHLRISLIGWQVEARDLNSSNGSVLQLPNGTEHRLLPGDSAIIAPGTKIVIGHRNLQYQSYRAS